MKINSVASLVSALDDSDEKTVSVRQFDSKNYETVDSIANLDRITEVTYPLQEVQDEHKPKLTVSIQRNGFDYSRGVPTVTLRTNLDDIGTAIKALLCLSTRKDWQTITPREIVVYGRSCHTLSSLVCSESKFSDVLKAMLTFAKNV